MDEIVGSREQHSGITPASRSGHFLCESPAARQPGTGKPLQHCARDYARARSPRRAISWRATLGRPLGAVVEHGKVSAASQRWLEGRAAPRETGLSRLALAPRSWKGSRVVCIHIQRSRDRYGRISDAHEWINEIPTVPIYYLANPQPRERAWNNQRGKKTLLSLTLV